MSNAPIRRDEALAARHVRTPEAGAVPAAPVGSVFNLARALAGKWILVAPLQAHGAEAELFLVKREGGEDRAVAKLYRLGLRPRSEALERLSGAAAEHVVRIFQRGLSDGVAYELMEHCRFGSLRSLMTEAAADPKWVRLVLAELAAALAAVHAEGIVHQDLKPENVLVRSLDPLRLVLTDFGTASVAHAPSHFVGTARTARYAAPEAITRFVTFKADYWSLGMMLLELLSGRHPFAGLSEALVHHLLVTRPVDLSGVGDPEWQGLLRGLLARNPERRWGAPEVGRWLGGDHASSPAGCSPDEEGFVASVRPYRLGDASCGTLTDLAAALVTHWEAGARDLAQGAVSTWLRDELRDPNLMRFVKALIDDPSLTPDMRLLRFVLHIAPRLPAVWQGVPLTEESLARLVGAAARGGERERNVLASLYEHDVLLIFPANHPDSARLTALRGRWRRRADLCEQIQLRLAADEHRARQDTGTAARFADPARRAYAGVAEESMTPQPLAHAVLLAPELAPEELASVREQLAAAPLDHCDWFRGAGSPYEVPVESVAALQAMLPRARRFADEQKTRAARRDEAARAEAAGLRGDVDALLRTTRSFAQQSAGALHVRAGLQGAYETYQRLSARAHADWPAPHEFAPLRRTLRGMGGPFVRIIDALDRLDRIDRLGRAVLRDGWPVVLALTALPVAARLPALLAVEALLAAGALGWYVRERASAARRVRRNVARLPEKVEDRGPGSRPEPAAPGGST